MPWLLGSAALFTGALGLAVIGLRADSIHDTPGRVLVIVGLLLTGVAYGGLQNLTLAQAFNAAGEPARSSVSIAWNLSFDAGTGLGAYTVIGGIPLRNYRAEVTLAPDAGGTRIRWAASWDRTLAGRLVQRSLRRAYPQIVADLARAAENQAAPVRG